MSDTPETDDNAYECIQRFDTGGSATAEKQSCRHGDCVPAEFARKLERERDMLKKILEERTNIANNTEDRLRAIIGELESALDDGDYCRVNKVYWFALITERDALRAEVERLETLYEAMKREKNDYQAQRDNIRLEADQLSTELHLERFSLKEMNAEVKRLKAAREKEFESVQQLNDEVEQLKADKARIDWLEKRESMEGFTRDAIDAAMKGEL